MPLQISKHFESPIWLTTPDGDVIEIKAKRDGNDRVKFVVTAPLQIGIHHKREYLIHALEELEHANGN